MIHVTVLSTGGKKHIFIRRYCHFYYIYGNVIHFNIELLRSRTYISWIPTSFSSSLPTHDATFLKVSDKYTASPTQLFELQFILKAVSWTEEFPLRVPTSATSFTAFSDIAQTLWANISVEFQLISNLRITSGASLTGSSFSYFSWLYRIWIYFSLKRPQTNFFMFLPHLLNAIRS